MDPSMFWSHVALLHIHAQIPIVIPGKCGLSMDFQVKPEHGIRRELGGIWARVPYDRIDPTYLVPTKYMCKNAAVLSGVLSGF